MKTKLHQPGREILSYGLIFLSLVSVWAEEPPRLSLHPGGAGLVLSWPSTWQDPDVSTVCPYFELQRSIDLVNCEPLGERQRAASPEPGQTLTAMSPPDQRQAFYRLSTTLLSRRWTIGSPSTCSADPTFPKKRKTRCNFVV